MADPMRKGRSHEGVPDGDLIVEDSSAVDAS